MLAATILASAIGFIDESVVNIALPAIEKDLGAPVAVMQWIVNTYILILAALLLVGGAAGDRFGRRRIFVIGIAVFAVSSLGCGLASGVVGLIAGRAAQGVGAALMIPCSLAIIGATFSESERGKAIGTWAGATSIAAAAAPLLGGWIVDHSTWRLIFLINPVLALPTILIALRHVPESRDPKAKTSLDWVGALLILGGLGSLTFGLIAAPTAGWTDVAVLAAIAGGIVLLAAFVWQEMHSAAPMMPPVLFGSRVFSGVNVMTLLLYAALGGAFFLLPFALIQVHGYSATVAGTSFLPFTVIMGSLSRWAGGLVGIVGARLPLVVGPLICALAFVLLAMSVSGQSYAFDFLLPICVLGLGMVVTVAPLTTTVINAVATRQMGAASGINNSVATIANLLAVAMFGALALQIYNGALDRHRAAAAAPVAQALAEARGQFVAAPAPTGLAKEEQSIAAAAVRDSLAQGIGAAMLLASALALAAALCALITMPPAVSPMPWRRKRRRR